MNLDHDSSSTTDINSVKHMASCSKKRKSVAITDGKGIETKKQKLIVDETVSKKNDPGWQIMYKMGFTVGKGLGARDQGITEPLAPSTQQNKRGLGMGSESIPLEIPKTKWKPEIDPASVTGDIVVSIDGERLFFDDIDLREGMTLGNRLTSIDEENNFCNPELLSEMLKLKTMLDEYGTFMDGRSRSNPYERIGAGIFLNRAAMKMANIDSVTNGLLTSTEAGETLFFADICAGPGGFTEYMLYRRPMQSCGFGFTLKESNDFKLGDIICGPVECFHPSYGALDNGDIFIESNLRKFEQEVKSGTGNIGVHTVLADGGFSVEGKENIQEILSKQLYLCQFLCAINIVRVGGNFLCKLFDTFTHFSVGLIHLVSSLFSKVSIIKPITSRPANSERYVLFQHLIHNPERLNTVRNYLFTVNTNLNDLKDVKDLKGLKELKDLKELKELKDADNDVDNDVIKIVSDNILKMDNEFYEFIKTVNDKILEQQIVALAKLKSFIVDRNLVDERQNDIRNDALKLWKIPDISREQYKNTRVTSTISTFAKVDLQNWCGELSSRGQKPVTELVHETFAKEKFVIRNHVAGFISRTIPELQDSTYVIIRNKRGIQWYNKKNDSKPMRQGVIQKKWLPTIPSFTLLLVHFSVEYAGEKGNLKVNSITVIDGAMIYGEDISQLSYNKRMDKIANLCRLLDPKGKGHIKPMEFFPLSVLEAQLQNRVSIRKAKNEMEQKMVSSINTQRFFPPWKFLIINTIKDPWMIAYSRSSQNIYYYNVLNRLSVADEPADLFASYSESNISEVDWTNDFEHFFTLFQKKRN